MATYRIVVKTWDPKWPKFDQSPDVSIRYEARRSAKQDAGAIGRLEKEMGRHRPYPQDERGVAWADVSDRFGNVQLVRFEARSGEWVRVA